MLLIGSGYSQDFLPAFSVPADGWAYTFEGEQGVASDDPFGSLDGTWDHINSSDRWDGSTIGDGSPGGVSALSEGDLDFIRVQDSGDPRDYGLDDPSNRRLYFTHPLSNDFTDNTLPDNLNSIVSDGVTLYFRMRLATFDTGPIDQLHPNGGDGIEEWPEQGIGYSQHNSGKSIIAIKESDGANVAFGLDYGREVNKDLFSEDGLVLPHRLQGDDLAGEGLSFDEKDSDPDKDADDVRDNEVGHIVPLDDLTDWQEFWVTIEAESLEVGGTISGTHLVNVYHGGSFNADVPYEFYITAGAGDDYRDDEEEESYIAIGAGATGAAGAFDIDFFSWKPGVHVPVESTLDECGQGRLLGDLDDDGVVGFSDFLTLSDNFGNLANSYDEGDIDCNGHVEFADFLVLSSNFGTTSALSQSVPEPSAASMLLAAMLFFACCKRRF